MKTPENGVYSVKLTVPVVVGLDDVAEVLRIEVRHELR
jgi:hypothetical protein